jgi:hypothetical protein
MAPRLRRGAPLIRGPSVRVGPGSAAQRFTLHSVRGTNPVQLRALTRGLRLVALLAQRFGEAHFQIVGRLAAADLHDLIGDGLGFLQQLLSRLAQASSGFSDTASDASASLTSTNRFGTSLARSSSHASAVMIAMPAMLSTICFQTPPGCCTRM